MDRALLAFDTSTEMMAVALHANGATVEWNGAGGALASVQLMPRIADMLAAQGLAVGDLGAIAFGRGPGAFTGLRTATAVAQGLAFGGGLPVIAVDSLLIVAEDARGQFDGTSDADIGVVMDARMGELYAARYLWHMGNWQVAMAPILCTAQALREAWWGHPSAQAPAHLAGNAIHLLEPPGCPRLSDLPEALPLTDRAAALMRLALRMHAQGAGADAAKALPLYVRDKVALTTQAREQARLQASTQAPQ
jgi:tRNA threonylcarbamoyladenosine biosynthesis protein TsaB